MEGRRSFSKTRLAVLLIGVGIIFFAPAGHATAAYHHMGEIDSGNFLSVFPDKAGTKLDSCNLCHSGGAYTSGGKTTTYGSCQWCHYKTDYGKQSTPANLEATLNPYGLDYMLAGRSAAAVQAIASLDSDGDAYTNADEIAAVRYPGDKADDPTKVTAPYRVFTREQLLNKPQHSQFLLMNASKSDDYYAQYSGVTLEGLLDDLMLGSATGTTVYAPDGFSQYHPLYPDASPSLYHVFGDYPASTYYYDETADMAKHPTTGWCRYDAPSAAGKSNGDPIVNPDGLKLLLAITRDGVNLTPGVLNKQNKLDGEGPFRVVPPQKLPGPPDQRSTVAGWTGVWPYDVNADHNAGFSTRTTTIIKVEPLPAGTTDINLLEAGWPYVDDAKIVVYGAIDPVPNILERLDALEATLEAATKKDFRNRAFKEFLIRQVEAVEWLVKRGWYGLALLTVQKEPLPETDACYVKPARHSDDLIADCDLQKQVQWALNEIVVLMNIAKAEGATPPPPVCHHHHLCARHAEMCRMQTHR
jgi:hypothetical protein